MKHKEKKRILRLRYKLFFTLVLGVLLAITLFLLVQSSGTGLIEKYYMDPTSVEERLMYYENSLDAYVTANEISSQDTAMLSQWVKAQGTVYLILYDDDTIIYESGWWDEKEVMKNEETEESETDDNLFGVSAVLSEDDIGADPDEPEEGTPGGAQEEVSSVNGEISRGTQEASGPAGEGQEDAADGQIGLAASQELESTGETSADSSYSMAVSYDIAFADGVYGASIIEFSEMQWYDLVDILSWCVFILTLFIVLLLYNRYITKRIIRLSKEVSVITDGNWEAAIHHRGNDEISQLSEGVDDLRNAMAQHFEREKEAWNVNSELITSMSHDIRMPLTSLIGYLDILDGEVYPSEDDCRRYVKSCRQKALQLKDLSDKMFQYFLVFGNDSIEMSVEPYDADILLQQIFAEQIFQLNSAGFSVKTDFTKSVGRIRADVQYINRLFDNLFSNVRKYAAPKSEVVLRTRMAGSEILISIGNEIRTDGALVESTNIGLKTCQKIVEQMKGRFRINRSETYFEVRIVFPIEPEEEKITKNLQMGGV